MAPQNEEVFVGLAQVYLDSEDVRTISETKDIFRKINVVVMDSGFSLHDMLIRQEGLSDKDVSHELGNV